MAGGKKAPSSQRSTKATGRAETQHENELSGGHSSQQLFSNPTPFTPINGEAPSTQIGSQAREQRQGVKRKPTAEIKPRSKSRFAPENSPEPVQLSVPPTPLSKRQRLIQSNAPKRSEDIVIGSSPLTPTDIDSEEEEYLRKTVERAAANKSARESGKKLQRSTKPRAKASEKPKAPVTAKMVPNTEDPRRSSTSTTRSGDQELDDVSENGDQASPSKMLAKRTRKSKGKQQQQQDPDEPKKPKSVKGRHSQFTEQPELVMKELEAYCRVMFLMKLNLDNMRELIVEIWGPDIRTRHWEWRESENRIYWNGNNWKRQAMVNMDAIVKEYMEAPDSHAARNVTDMHALVHLFAKSYSASRFAYVFSFATPVVDIVETAKGSEEANFYFENIYANFAARIKLMRDWVADPRGLRDWEFSRANILGMFNRMADSEMFMVTMEDLCPPKERVKRVKKDKKKFPGPDKDKNWVWTSEPPNTKRRRDKAAADAAVAAAAAAAKAAGDKDVDESEDAGEEEGINGNGSENENESEHVRDYESDASLLSLFGEDGAGPGQE